MSKPTEFDISGMETLGSFIDLDVNLPKKSLRVWITNPDGIMFPPFFMKFLAHKTLDAFHQGDPTVLSIVLGISIPGDDDHPQRVDLGALIRYKSNPNVVYFNSVLSAIRFLKALNAGRIGRHKVISLLAKSGVFGRTIPERPSQGVPGLFETCRHYATLDSKAKSLLQLERLQTDENCTECMLEDSPVRLECNDQARILRSIVKHERSRLRGGRGWELLRQMTERLEVEAAARARSVANRKAKKAKSGRKVHKLESTSLSGVEKVAACGYTADNPGVFVDGSSEEEGVTCLKCLSRIEERRSSAQKTTNKESANEEG